MEVCIDENKLKELMKETIFEVLKDKRELIYDIVAEVMEDRG